MRRWSFSLSILFLLLSLAFVLQKAQGNDCISFESKICSDVVSSYPSRLVASSKLIADITESVLVSYGILLSLLLIIIIVGYYFELLLINYG